MVDLGCASTEVVVARGHDVIESASLRMGSGVLARTYLSDPPTPQERARLRRAALREVARAPDGEVERLVATGGTASNLPFLLARRNPPLVLTTEDLLRCESRLDRDRSSEVGRAVALPPNRVRAMRAGIEAMLLFLDWYGLSLLHISHEGLRHGMLLAFLAGKEDWWRDGRVD
jgi:exopolyphosphatase/pppGpp-phosphohydrolase